MSSLQFHKLTVDDTILVDFVNEEMRSMHWRFGPKDIECLISVSDPGMYIAKLDGVPIGCLRFHQHSNDYYTFFFYIVKEKYRGKGYGLQMFETIKKKVDWSQNISSFPAPKMVDKFKRFGFQSRFVCTRCFLQLSTALDILQTLPLPQDLMAKDPCDVDQEDLLSYDTNVFGYQRRAFILKFLYNEYHHCKVAVDNKGNIVGYMSARVVLNKDDGYDISQLFADSLEAAYVLLKAVLEKMKISADSSSEDISIYCPLDMNVKSKDLVDVLKGNRFYDFKFVSTKDLPKGCMDKWFGVYLAA